MKNKLIITLLVILLTCKLHGQDSIRRNFERVHTEAWNTIGGFSKMFSLANANYKGANTKSCDAYAYIKNLKKDTLIPEYRGILEFAEEFGVKPSGDMKFKEDYDKGAFKTVADKVMFSWSTSKDFSSFVSKFTEQEIEDVNKKDRKTLRQIYDSFKHEFKTGTVFYLIETYPNNRVYSSSLRKENCYITTESTITIVSYSYPKFKLALKTKVSLNCTCESNMGPSNIKKALYEYTASATAINTAKEFKFDKSSVKNAQLIIGGVSCCPGKEEEETAASFIPDAQDLIINDDPPLIILPKGNILTLGAQADVSIGNEETSEEITSIPKEVLLDLVINDDPPLITLPSGFTLATHVGLPLGKEADFFSLDYGFDLNYLFGINEDFRAGFGAGFTQFAGKDVNGSKTKGVGFVPIYAKVEYSLSEQIAAYGNLGYGIATDQGSGGINVVAGAKYMVKKKVGLGFEYRSILVEGGSFSSIGLAACFDF